MSTILKCKMCGGDLEANGDKVATCLYCGSKQILPKMTSERKATLYERANHYRCINEFDKAEVLYEQALAEDSEDAEVYWDIVLCHYGIEYVEDPRTKRRMPTVNRTQYQSIFDNQNYIKALQYASEDQKSILESEAKIIDNIQKGILDISNKEHPYDIFICYKESDDRGQRTPDSVLAQDIYNELVKEEYKVFFSRITLEDKLGSAYEPYIFAALNSAKIMIAVGLKPEHYNAVWVRNEWSRFLGLLAAGDKMLIPAYKDMNPYELPDEFAHLQAIDMGKLGSMQDLLHVIRKIIRPSIKPDTSGSHIDIVAYKSRIEDFLETADFSKAIEYCDKVLDFNPKDAEVHCQKLCAEVGVRNISELKNAKKPFDTLPSYKNAVKYGDKTRIAEINKCLEIAKNRLDKKNKRLIISIFSICAVIAITLGIIKIIIPYSKYNVADKLYSQNDYDAAIAAWSEVETFGDSKERISEAYEAQYSKQIQEYLQNEDYSSAEAVVENASKNKYAISKVDNLRNLIFESKYKKAISLMESAQYEEAEAIFSEITEYSDAATQLLECDYLYACDLFNDGVYYTAKNEFLKLGDYKDSEEKVELCNEKLQNIGSNSGGNRITYVPPKSH